MDIYTGRGDEGETDLRDMSRVSKANPRIEASGTVDELNACIGRIRPTGHEPIDDRLRAIQNHLHIVQADLGNPDPDDDDPQVSTDHVETIEKWIDDVQAEIDPLEAFILPGGGDAGAGLHHARAVCRRAERRVVAFHEASDDTVNQQVAIYLNRLSDALFTFGRYANAVDGVDEEHPTY